MKKSFLLQRLLVCSVVLTLALPQAAFAAGKFLSIGTAKIGSTWYPMGAGLADVLKGKIPGYQISVEETSGADENARRIIKGDMEVGFAVVPTGISAYEGTGLYEGKPKSVLAWFSLENRYQASLSLASSGIKTVNDIKGKRVGIGLQGSANYFDGRYWLWAHGIELTDVKPFYMGQAEQAAALKDGRIDVMLWTTGVPSATIQELAIARDLNYIPTTKKGAEKLHAQYPYYYSVTLPAGSYKGMSAYPTILNNSLLILDPKLPEDVVYKMTEAVFSSLDKLKNIHPVFKTLELDNAIAATPIPLHPGALRYFKEKKAKGVERFLK